jgi:hypothetical protein
VVKWYRICLCARLEGLSEVKRAMLVFGRKMGAVPPKVYICLHAHSSF